jgi:hydroxyethylthiazole kinase-like uncharacterized protein yjeF
MQPLLTAKQIQDGDKYTIAHEPISSIDLMERAAKAFEQAFTARYGDIEKSIAVYCGTGNNGGDGLAIARLLTDYGFEKITVKIARFSEKASENFTANLQRLQQSSVSINEFKSVSELGDEPADIIIDALLGNGLNKPLEGEYAQLVQQINNWHKIVVAVDVPTGFYGEDEIDPDATVIKADLAITFQQPKINFLLPDSKHAIKNWVAVDIGIDKSFTQQLNSPYQYLEEADIKQILKPRERFSNKGTYGHALIVAGQAETMGAALLCSSACAQAGAGLTTACIPKSGLVALNCYMPEIMAIVREGDLQPTIDWSKFNTMGIGPGLGKDDSALALFTDILTNYTKPVVIDADALNLLATHKPLWASVPKGSVLTPHMKEFDRLFGEHKNWWQRIHTAMQKAKELGIYIVLKNDYTIIASPDEMLYFNSTSNAAMASGGMGDVLTGIITALLAQRYSPLEACLAGVYIHGKAGDDLALPHKLMVVLPEKVAAQVSTTMAGLTA